MADVFVEENTLRGIANAIRSKNGSSATYFPAEMEQAIRDLQIPDVSALDATAADILYPKKAFTADGETEGTIQTKSASDVTVSGDTVSAPAGYYPAAVSKSVQDGSAATPATIIPANPTISVNNSTGVVTASVNETQAITPTVSEGYVSAGTPGNVRASGSATSQLPTQGAATITPTRSQQTAVAAGKFTTGDVIVDPIPSEYIVPTGTKQISITANGTTTEDVAAYANAEITVNVPNTYAASDEGKVVSNGALVSQGSDTVTANDTYDTTLINSLTVNVSGGEEEPIPDPIKDVVFVDYDGEIVEQYTAQEFLALTALPANPSHSGLTAQGWNWTLADAQAYVQKYGALVVGQNYVTDDGKTRLYLDMVEQIYPRTLTLTVTLGSSSTVVIAWGDGETTTLTGSGSKEASHTYAVGKYVCTLECTAGSYTFGNTTTATRFVGGVGAEAIIAAEIGTTLSYIYAYAFSNAINMQTVSVPAGITNFTQGRNTYGGFATGRSCKCVVFPSGTTIVGPHDNVQRFISFPKSLTTVTTKSRSGLRAYTLPEAAAQTGYGFNMDYAEHIVIPAPPATLGGGSYSTGFLYGRYCRRFDIADTVTTIAAAAFNGLYGITEMHIRPTTPPTLNNTSGMPPSLVANGAVIYVPYSADHSVLEAYQTATNWSSFASIMQEEPQ